MYLLLKKNHLAFILLKEKSSMHMPIVTDNTAGYDSTVVTFNFLYK